MIVKDAKLSIESTLNSLKDFREVVVYDNGSTDGTIDIARRFDNVVLIEGEFYGFGQTKNRATSYTSNDWVLSLDSDEIMSSELTNNIKNLTLDDKTVYSLLRINYYKNRQIKYCWSNDIIARLYNKNETAFVDNSVHEYVIQKGYKNIILQGVISHYPYQNITDFITKLDRYSTIFAQENRNKKASSPTKAIFNGIYSFIKTYFFKKGFLDGYSGLVIAFSHMATNFYKYIKLYELNKKN
jgi:glycosyltransferase involved in cell wall biosynthesis